MPAKNVAVVEDQVKRFSTFKEEVYADLDTISSQLLSVVGKIKANILSKRNPDGVLRHEASEYLSCFQVRKARLQEIFGEDSDRWNQ